MNEKTTSTLIMVIVNLIIGVVILKFRLLDFGANPDPAQHFVLAVKGFVGIVMVTGVAIADIIYLIELSK